MVRIPFSHPKVGEGLPKSKRIKSLLTGGMAEDDDLLAELFPQYIDSDSKIEHIDRDNVLSTSYSVDKTYFVKLIRKRHLIIHGVYMWIHNRLLDSTSIPPVFTSFDSVEDMCQYEYNAANQTFRNGGEIPKPHDITYSEEHNIGGIVYEYVQNEGRMGRGEQSSKAVNHLAKSMRRMHETGHTHLMVPSHITVGVPHGTPYLTDPTGRVKDDPKARTIGIGYDLAKLIIWHGRNIGAFSAVDAVNKYYSGVELVSAYHIVPITEATTPAVEGWIIRHTQKSIKNVVSESDIKEYEDLIGSLKGGNEELSIDEETMGNLKEDGKEDSGELDQDDDSNIRIGSI